MKRKPLFQKIPLTITKTGKRSYSKLNQHKILSKNKTTREVKKEMGDFVEEERFQ